MSRYVTLPRLRRAIKSICSLLKGSKGTFRYTVIIDVSQINEMLSGKQKSLRKNFAETLFTLFPRRKKARGCIAADTLATVMRGGL